MSSVADFEYLSKTKIKSGEGVSSIIDEELRRRGAENPLIVTDANIVELGVLDPIEEALLSGGAEYIIFDDVVPNPKAETFAAAVDQFSAEGCDSVIAIGGGSSIDTAKAISILVENGGEISEYYGVDNVPEPVSFPLVTVPTTAGTGSEVTPAAVVSEPADKQKMPIISENIFPTVAILDPTLLESLPQHITAATGLDALTQAIMPYLSKNSNPLTDAIAIDAVRMIADNLPRATAGESIEAYANMQIATSMGGMVFINAGLGLVHAMSHPVGGFFDTPHGVTNAIILPHVLRFNRIAREEKYVDLADAMGVNVEGRSTRDASLAFIEAVEDLIEDLGIPARLRDIGVEENALEDLAEATVTRAGSKRLVNLNARRATKEDVLEIFESAY
jgi:alcohol dehydrogenase class IV